MRTRWVIVAYATMYLILAAGEYLGWLGAGFAFEHLWMGWLESGLIVIACACIYILLRPKP